jgi:hypothetical protein
MFYIVSKYLFPKSYRGFALFPFIFIKYKSDKTNAAFINHEKIHLRQQLELLVLPFLIWYVLEFVFRLIQHKNWDLGYRNISFEREAYGNDFNPNYLKYRSFWSFLKYLN